MAFPRIAAVTVVPLLLGTFAAAVAWAGSPRFARLGDMQGPVEVQFEAADAWRPASPNLPLTESTRIRTGPGARLEIELDDASAFRMAGEGLAELTDYSRLSGGQKITVLSLDSGLAYFTGEPAEGRSIHLLVPGAQATLTRGSRIRLQADLSSSEIAVIEGAVHFTVPSADMDLHQGQSARVTIPASDNFSLFREIAPVDPDGWSEQLDQAEADAPSSRLDLDRSGKWISTGDYGEVWRPPSEAGWAPFRQGRWLWFQSAGFTWQADERWGWKPYHEGRWLQHPDLGWIWIPGPDDAPFSPGAVYWARSNNLAAWGPLAPGEPWPESTPPRQLATLNTTAGAFVSGAREIVPAPAAELPEDLLKAFTFTAALPSPALPLARLSTPRDPLRTRQFSAVDVVPAVRQVMPAEPAPETGPAMLAEAPPPPAPVAAPSDPDPAPDAPAAPVVPGVVVLTQPAWSPDINIDGPSLVKDLFARWLSQYHESRIRFNAAGSAAAIEDLSRNSISLAVTDSPLSIDRLQTLSPMKPLQLAIALDAVVVVYHIGGYSGELKLTPGILSAIYLGEIRQWNDRRIAAANQGIYLPAGNIVVVHRSDACATTRVFTDYLSKVSPDWKARVGAAGTVTWPVTGLAAQGDDGLAIQVQQTPGAIGYLDLANSRKFRLPVAWLKNKSGTMLQPTAASLTAAAASSESLASLANASGSQSYPIASAIWAVSPSPGIIGDQLKRRALTSLLDWILTAGQQQFGDLLFAPLPPAVLTQEQKQVRGIQ
jgi:phosphate transport system substrate-binding protein